MIGRGTTIEGTVKAQGRIQVDGRIEGTLEVQGEVSIGPSGSVVGTLISDQLAVGGQVQGTVQVRSTLHVLSGGTVRGEIRYDSLQVDRGGVLDGTTQHGDRPQEEIVAHVDSQPVMRVAVEESGMHPNPVRATAPQLEAVKAAPPLPAGRKSVAG
ncbi:MAG TPA: polymer-forming cytoskeletal protein [Polyangiales bacterium]|nr:polymer-forming cytoskeletal protein [Polyangiales bacterium]